MNSMTSACKKRLLIGFMVFVTTLLGLTAWQWRNGAPISASLLDILPKGTLDPVQLQAQQQMQAPLDKELILLIQQPDAADATQLDWVKQQLEHSGLFAHVQSTVTQNLDQLRQELLTDRAALLPLTDRQLLANNPELFAQQRIEQLFDPIQGFSLVRPEQDWLGISLRIQQHLQPDSKVQVDLQGHLYALDEQGVRWALIRASTKDTAFNGNLSLAVAQQVELIRQQLASQNLTLLASSGLLFAASGQAQASTEMQWIGGISTIGALLLIVLLFRSIRSLLAFLPAILGMWVGVTLCVLLFGKIHVMTLVLGASLIGVTIDFPLHYLSKAWRDNQWDSWGVLQATLSGLTLGVITNAIGYLALAFTPFPALTQVAVFSVAGLLAAYLTTVCLLPWLFQAHQMHLSSTPVKIMQWLLDIRAHLLSKVSNVTLALALIIFTLGGLWHLQVKDDLRAWVNPEANLLTQAQQIGQITGYQPTSQFFLVRADSEALLFSRLQQITDQLDHAIQQQYLTSYMAPNQLLAGKVGSPSLQQVTANLSAEQFAGLVDVGIAPELLTYELQQLSQLPERDSQAVLQNSFAEPWRNLWLQQDDGSFASMVSLQGVKQLDDLAALATGIDGVTWVDRPAELNQLFKQAQTTAIELKIISSVLILIVLSFALGVRGALVTVGVSLCAAVVAAACLGWMGQTLTLFSLFGLLLVTAIGVDYAIIMYEGVGGAAVSLLGTFLAAVTTWLSFGLLGVSSTPVVSSFGIAVTLGLLFCFLFSPWAYRGKPVAAV